MVNRNIKFQLQKKITKGPSINYVGKILPIFDPPLPLIGKHRHSANPSPPVYVGIYQIQNLTIL